MLRYTYNYTSCYISYTITEIMWSYNYTSVYIQLYECLFIFNEAFAW